MPINIAELAGGFAERAGEELIGFGVGTALGRGLEPEATRLAQLAWSSAPDKALEPDVAADLVAQEHYSEGQGAGEAKQTGISGERFADLAEHARTGPSFADLLNLWRRGSIDDATLVAGLRKLKLDAKWHSPLGTLKEQPLTAQELAVAIQRGLIHDPGFLPVGPPTGGGTVPPMPVASIDAVHEAEWTGFSAERLATLTRTVGLPPGPVELMQLINRGHIDETDFHRGIAEGNTRNEWAAPLLNLRRTLISPSQYAELHLRGWIDNAAMKAGGALHGVEPDDQDLLHSLHGRSLAVHQVQTGEKRGGTYNGETSSIPESFLRAVQQSSIRPEWYSLAYANRHTLPSPFVLRALIKDGSITVAEGTSLFEQMGWPEDLAAAAAKGAAGSTGGKADSHVGKAETQLWTTLHKSYVDANTSEAEAAADLDAIGVPADQHAAILALWAHEREIVRRSLTPKQIKVALGEGKFTNGEALDRLKRLGYSQADADTYLAE